MSTGTISWLHLSDLHLKASYPYHENVVLQALLRNVGEFLKQEEILTSFIIVTGDIAFSGQSAEYQIARRFFDDLLQITRVPKTRLILIPGNHDIDRELIPDQARLIFKKKLKDPAHVHDFLEDAAARELVFRPFKGYGEFINDYFTGQIPFDADHYYYVHNLQVNGRQISLLGLNSAWLDVSYQDTARGLLIGGVQARSALNEAVGADLKIALTHHPLSWLRRFDQKDSGALLSRECDFILQGHVHHTSMTQSNTPGHHVITVTSGACFKTRKYLNQYNFVKYNQDKRNGLIFFRRFFETPHGFWMQGMLNRTNVPDGVYQFNL